MSPSLAVCGRITATAFFARFPNVDYSAHRKCLDVVISLKDASGDLDLLASSEF